MITGAGSGIGRAMAERFARAGMHVVLADVEAPALDEAVASVTEVAAGAGTEVIGIRCDVTDEASVTALAEAAIERFGRVNVVGNNAGVAGSTATGALGEIRLADWKWVLDVNLWGVIHGHQAFLPHLLEHGDGHIVNTASMAGHFPGHNAYAASKWAVVALSEGLHHQLAEADSPVGVSCLCPGWVNTRILESDRNRPEWAAPRALTEPSAGTDARLAFVRDQIASGRSPADVADLVHDAVVGNRFWVFTDSSMVAMLEARFDSVLNGTNPVPVFPRD